MKKLEQLRKEVGWSKIIEEQEGIVARQGSFECRIEAAHPMSRADLELKLAMYDNNNRSEEFAEYLIRDLRRLLHKPQAFAA